MAGFSKQHADKILILLKLGISESRENPVLDTRKRFSHSLGQSQTNGGIAREVRSLG